MHSVDPRYDNYLTDNAIGTKHAVASSREGSEMEYW
jgi:hypothetical protein